MIRDQDPLIEVTSYCNLGIWNGEKTYGAIFLSSGVNLQLLKVFIKYAGTDSSQANEKTTKAAMGMARRLDT